MSETMSYSRYQKGLPEVLMKRPINPHPAGSPCLGSELLRIFDNPNLGMFRISPDGQYGKANMRLLELLGCQSEKDLLACINNPQRASQWYVNSQHFHTLVSLLNEQGQVKHFEAEVYTFDKTERIWVSHNIWTVKNPEGDILYYEGILEDITQRKQYQLFQEVILEFIGETLQHGLDEGFYQRLLTQAVKAVPGAQAGSILIKEPDKEFRYVAAVGFDLQQLQKNPINSSFYLNPTSQPSLINHYPESPPRSSEWQIMLDPSGKPYNLKSTLCIGISHKDHQAFLFLDNFERHNAFSLTAQHIAEAFGQQVAVLLDRLNMEQGLKRSQKTLETWNTFHQEIGHLVSDMLQNGLNASSYKQLLKHTLKIIPAAEAATMVMRQTDGSFTLTAAVGCDVSKLQNKSFSSKDVKLPGSVKMFEVHNNITFACADQQVTENIRDIFKVKSLLTIPIYLDKQIVAYIHLHNVSNPNAFDELSLKMTRTISRQVSSLLKRFQLEEQLCQKQHELERWVDFRNNLFNFISDTLQHGLDESFYQRLLEHAIAVIPGVDAGSIIMRNHDGLYYYVAALGYDMSVLRQITYNDQEIIINVSLEPLIVNNLQDINDHTLDPQKRELLHSSGPVDKIKAMMSLPAIVEGQVVANLSLDTFGAEGFSAEAKEMAKAFATQIGVVLKRLTLEQQLEQSNHKLTRLASYDSLTGLPNRLLFADRLEQSFAQSRRSGDIIGLLYMDLDGFKDINDSLGHNIGDALLKAVAARLSTHLREEDTIARLGGDEFAIILSSLSHAQDAASIAQKILDCLGASFEVHGQDLHIGASIGISLYPENGHTVEDLLRYADTAMYQAKRSGKNRFHFFTPELNHQILEQRQLEADLRRGLERNEFYLHYQPRIHLQTRCVESVEALLRWKHPTRGSVSPMTFIPLAEKTGFIVPLTCYVFEKACIQAKLWKSQGKHVRVAVNLSAKCLQHKDLVPKIREILETHKLETTYIELEVTESAAMEDVEGNAKTLNTLRDMGIYIAVDDFGTAYSSMNYLKKLPVSCLKIDRSFVKDIGLAAEDSADIAIVKAIVTLGKALGFDVVAEGVETLEQATFLQSLGCDEAQGYYFCKPLPPEELFKDTGAEVTLV